MEAPANEMLRIILGEDYDEESMQKMIGHAINTLIPDKVEELIKGIGCMGPSIYIKYGIIDEDKYAVRWRKKMPYTSHYCQTT